MPRRTGLGLRLPARVRGSLWSDVRSGVRRTGERPERVIVSGWPDHLRVNSLPGAATNACARSPQRWAMGAEGERAGETLAGRYRWPVR
jgi:hypothetical protein